MFKVVGCLMPTFLQPPVFWARLQILERLSFYWKRRERAGADHNCTLFETYQSYLCSSLLAIWWQLFWNLQFSELVSNFRAAGFLLKTEKKGCSSLHLWFIWNNSKLLLLMFIGVWWELFSNLLWVVWHIRKRQKHLAFFFVTEGKDRSSSRWSLIWKLKAACTKVWRCLVVIIPSLATTTDGSVQLFESSQSNPPIIIVSRGITCQWK